MSENSTLQAHTRPDAFCLKIRVRYSECDAQNVVFNARYGDYVDLAATEFLRAVIGGYQALLEMGYDNQVVRLLTQWKSPARFDDVIACCVEVTHTGNTSFTFTVTMTQADEGTAVAVSEVTYVLIDTKSQNKTALPESLKAKLEAGAPGVVIDQSGL